jgi:membrane-associated phospholipid phosphatase
MLFTIIYLEARWVLVRLRYVKTILQMTCFIAAFVTMLSRVSDYHHRGSDVIGGTVLGERRALGKRKNDCKKDN